MKVNIKKIFIILMFSILIFSFFSNFAYGEYDWDFEQFDGVDTKGTGNKIENAGSTIIAVFQVVAIGVSVVMLVVTGIMYVLSATTDKKAEIKKHMPNYFIGVIFTFTAAVLLQIVREFINSNING